MYTVSVDEVSLSNPLKVVFKSHTRSSRLLSAILLYFDSGLEHL